MARAVPSTARLSPGTNKLLRTGNVAESTLAAIEKAQAEATRKMAANTRRHILQFIESGGDGYWPPLAPETVRQKTVDPSAILAPEYHYIWTGELISLLKSRKNADGSMSTGWFSEDTLRDGTPASDRIENLEMGLFTRPAGKKRYPTIAPVASSTSLIEENNVIMGQTLDKYLRRATRGARQ